MVPGTVNKMGADGHEGDNAPDFQPEPIKIEIGPELDLHVFPPKEVGEIVDAYIEECVEKGYERVRLVHGKGIGHLRRTVHARLEKNPSVESFSLASEGEGSWGATIAFLRTNS